MLDHPPLKNNSSHGRTDVVTTVEDRSACSLSMRIVEHPMWWCLGLGWAFFVVCSGAALVLLQIPGACLSKTQGQCNKLLNISIQLLTVCFTLISLYALPGRIVRVWGLFGNLYGVTGKDWRGVEVPYQYRRSLLLDSYDPPSFYKIPWSRRATISFFWLFCALFQFANQVFHAVFSNLCLLCHLW